MPPRNRTTAAALATEPLPPARERPLATGEVAARRLPDAALVEHIVEHHHAYARRALPYVVPLLAKVAAFHGKRNRKLGALYDAGIDLADALEAHIDEEERALFPSLLARTSGYDAPAIEQLARHHREVRLHLARVRWLADDFAVPSWAGSSYQALMEELEALEEDVVEHVHLESFVLVPRLSSGGEEARS